jgi:heterodisulfide reductase subunit B2
MEIGYYPGCSLESAAREFDISLRAVCDMLDITLVEVPDWVCCGSSPIHATSQELSYLLPYKNIQKAEAHGIKELLIPCPSCLYSISQAEAACTTDAGVRQRLSEVTGYTYEGGLKIYHLLDFLRDRVTLESLKAKVKKPLSGLKVASYYGCLTRFFPAAADDVEQPGLLEEIIGALGGQAVEWTCKVECCGASLSITRPDITKRLLGEILKSATRASADCIAVVCPLCQSNLDIRQKDLTSPSGTPYAMPVVYLTQLIGIALGAQSGALGMEKLIIDAGPLLRAKELA